MNISLSKTRTRVSTTCGVLRERVAAKAARVKKRQIRADHDDVSAAERVAALQSQLDHERARVRTAELRIDVVRREVSDLRARLAEASTLDDLPREATRDGDVPPSFRYKLGEQRRISLELTDGLGVREPVWQVNPKLGGRAFAERLGVEVPRLLFGPVAIDDLDIEAIPDHFVIKPVAGHSSRGVFLLHRVGRDRYQSLLDRAETFSSRDLLDRYAQWLNKGLIPETVIVEQLIFDGSPANPIAPIDFRFFCFYGEVGFVMARDGHGTRAGSRVRFRFFDDHWEDLGVVRLDVTNDAAIAVPRQAESMVEVARRLSASIPRPMVRIDLFDSDNVAWFGEVTPFPGGSFTMATPYDRRFGAQWERAEARLERDAIESGIRTLG
jgi:TupA-like ATPgrasp